MEGLLTALKARSAGAGPLAEIESAVVGLRQNLKRSTASCSASSVRPTARESFSAG